jgi:nitroreductase
MSRRAPTDEPLHDLLAERWSPRSFVRDHELGEDDVTTLLEAARWAPSAQNRQPRRFVAARRGTDLHALVTSAVYERNRWWAERASLLVLGIVERVGADGRAQRFAEYDLGQAVAHLTVQAHHLGLHVRQIGGFDAAVAAERLDVAAPYEPWVLVAVGRATETADLEPEHLERDTAPRVRLPLTELVRRRA